MNILTGSTDSIKLKKIIHLYPTLIQDADGAATVVRSLIREQIIAGYDVYYGIHKVDDAAELDTLHLRYLDFFLLIQSIFCNKLVSIYGKDFDKRNSIVHIHGLWSVLVLLFAIIFISLRSSVVHSPHGMMSAYSFKYKKYKKLAFHYLFQSWIVKKFTLRVATSEDEKQDIFSNFGVLNIEIIRNGIDLPESSFFRKNKSKILYFGRVHPKKNVHRIIEAWHLIESDFPNLSLSIVGSSDPSYLKFCKDLVRDNNVLRVSFSPSVSYTDRYSVFSNALATILVSENENFGLVVGESLVCGVPVIVGSNLPWSRVAEIGCGFLVASNPVSIAEALRQISLLPSNVASEMGMRGHEWIKTEFAWADVASEYVQVYKRALLNLNKINYE